MKEKVISTLANHDGLRAHEREAFAAYLLDVFTKAETSAVQIAELTEQNAALANRLAVLEQPKQ
jgi:hypothetical protein